MAGYCHARALVHRDDADALVLGFRHHRERQLGQTYGVEDEMRSVLARIERDGPLLSRALDSARRVNGGWDAAGLGRAKATSAALELLWWEGRIAVMSRAGGQKTYDLAARHLPALDHLIETLPHADAARAAARHQHRTMGIVGPGLSGPAWGGGGAAARRTWSEALAAEGDLVRVSAEGRSYWVWRAVLDESPPSPRRDWLLAPLDNLLWHRPRLEALAGFRYRGEISTPARRRRMDPYDMPVLQGARFWGEADARWEEGRLAVRVVPAALGAEPVAGALAAVAAAETLCARVRTPSAPGSGSRGRGR